MKKLFVGSIVVYITCVLGTSAFCQSATCTVTGSVTDLSGIGYVPISESNIDIETNLEASASVDGGGSSGGSTATGTADAALGDRFIRVTAGAVATTAGPHAGGPESTSSGVEAEAKAVYGDTLMFSNLGVAPGTPIHLVWIWNVTGSVSSSATASGPAQVNYLDSSGTAKLTISGTGVSDGTFASDSSVQLWTQSPLSGQVSHDHEDPDTTLTVRVDGVAGTGAITSVPFSITADADAVANSFSFDWVGQQGGGATANSDFSHTLLWGGITSITDDSGNPITGWTVTSASGYDYSQPAPEPATFVLLAIALPGLLLARRHYRSL